ncbi:hypothetical protein GEMRC1_009901 [Eukaryota sp. GEM-RC1]
MLMLTDWISSRALALGFQSFDLKHSVSRENSELNEVTKTMLLLQAEVHAYLGNFKRASEIFLKIGRRDLAIDMYSDLCRWSEVPNPSAELLSRQGKWDLEVGNIERAVEMFKEAGDYLLAIKLLAEKNNSKLLYELAKITPVSEREAIRMAAQALSIDYFDWTVELYTRIGDYKELLGLYQSNGHWKKAFATLNQLTEDPDFVILEKNLNANYAASLADSEDFDLALNYMRKSNQSNEIKKLIESLIEPSITEGRYRDTAHYYWLYSQEVKHQMEVVQEDEFEALVELATRFRLLAEVYYTFSFVNEYNEIPFSSLSSDTLFNICVAHLSSLHQVQGSIPRGISLSFSLFTLLKLSKSLSCFRVMRSCLDRIHKLVLPPMWLAVVECISLHSRAAPFSDSEELCPLCYRCGAQGALLGESGDVCSTCGNLFVRSRKSFVQLPLLEFELEEDITSAEALSLIREPYFKNQRNIWQENVGDEVQTLSMNTGEVAEAQDDLDGFSRILLTSDPQEPLIVDRAALQSLAVMEVIVLEPRFSFEPTRYFKIMNNSVGVSACDSCHSFFLEEEFVLEQLLKGKCCFCRNQIP